jgi:hypothetical protein
MSSSMLELILDLLSDEDELQKYEANTDKYLFDAGLGGCAAEAKDLVAMSTDMAPTAHAAKAAVAPAAKDDDDDDKGGKDHGHKDHDDHGHKDHDDHGHKDHGDVHNTWTTNNTITNSTHNGDSYDISAEGDVALNGGINFGEDNEVEDFTYAPNDSFNENGSGVQINDDTDFNGGGDLNSAGGSGSAINTGTIDNSSTDVVVSDNVLQFGENNQNESDGSNQDTEESATGGGTVDTVDDSIIVEDNKVDVDIDD